MSTRSIVVVVLAAPQVTAEWEERLQSQKIASVVRCTDRREVLAALEAHPAELLLVDCEGASKNSLAVVREVRERWPDLVILGVAPTTSQQSVLETLAVGVTDVLHSELFSGSSDEALRQALATARAQSDYAQFAPPPPTQFSNQMVLGESPAMQRVAQLIEKVAPSAASVLIRGESGTGKELVARALHAKSALAEKPFIKIDCASLPENLLESELFGYEKGAFTGASARKLGRVELADGGTLFLDEVGELTLPTQAKLLRLLQDREFERLGGTKTIRVQLRVLAATHRDLEAMSEQQQFRQDLFYRLNVVPLWLPPLRARRGDTPALVRHFCQQAAQRNQRSVTLSEPAVKALASERWPGNVRQLQNFIERLVVLAPNELIDVEDVRSELERPVQFETEIGKSHSAMAADLSPLAPEPASAPPEPIKAPDDRLSQIVRDAEQQALLQTLQRCGGNRSQAARALGVSRSTFYAKMKQYGLL